MYLQYFLDLQPLWPFSVTKPDFSDLGCSSRHIISKTKSVTPHFFYNSGITNSSSFNGKILRKKSMLENFRASVLKVAMSAHTFVQPPVATTFPQRPVFQNTKRFQVKSLYLEPLVSGHLSKRPRPLLDLKV